MTEPDARLVKPVTGGGTTGIRVRIQTEPDSAIAKQAPEGKIHDELVSDHLGGERPAAIDVRDGQAEMVNGAGGNRRWHDENLPRKGQSAQVAGCCAVQHGFNRARCANRGESHHGCRSNRNSTGSAGAILITCYQVLGAAVPAVFGALPQIVAARASTTWTRLPSGVRAAPLGIRLADTVAARLSWVAALALPRVGDGVANRL